MTRKFKALGLALFAILAMSAIGAQGASATVTHTFKSEKDETVLTGVGTNAQRFVGTGLVVDCSVSRFNGTVGEKEADQIEVYPEYEVCEEINSGLKVHVVNKGCTFRFESDTEETVSALHAPVALTCEHGQKSITITDENSLCIIHFSDTHTTTEPVAGTLNQQLHGVTYTNGGSGTTKDITVDATVTGITYEMTEPFCELLGAVEGTHHDGEYSGKATVKGYVDVDNPDTVHKYEHNGEHVGIELVTP